MRLTPGLDISLSIFEFGKGLFMSRKRTWHRRHVRASSSNPQYLLFSPKTTLGWRVVRNIDRDLGERFVERGWYRQVLDAGGALIGYQPVRDSNGDAKLQSRQSPVALTAHDMQLIAGCFGKSKTMGMSEDRRLSRRHPVTGRVLPPEDAIERAFAKLAVYEQTRMR